MGEARVHALGDEVNEEMLVREMRVSEIWVSEIWVSEIWVWCCQPWRICRKVCPGAQELMSAVPMRAAWYPAALASSR